MEIESIYHFIHSFWLLWLLVVFAGIIVWVMWPRRKKELESHAQIPLRDDDPE